jgi:hypothetical protein
MSSKGWSIGILSIILISMIVYVIIIFELHKHQAFIFKPYDMKADTHPNNPFYPQGTVTALTPDEIEERQALLAEYFPDQ